MDLRKSFLILLGLILLVACTPTPAGESSRRNQSRNNISKVVKKKPKKGSSAAPKTPSNTNKYSAEEIYKRCNPAVFTITAGSSFFTSQGSGFFISSTGLAVSNYHVLQGTYLESAMVSMPSGAQYGLIDIIAQDEVNDFILFRVNVGNKNVPYLNVTNRKPVIGQKIYAIGSPRGLENTFSSGEISQLRGDNVIQINAPIDHGSSGGVLLNEYGEAIGITSAGMDDSGANLNFAVDIDVIKPYIW